MYKEEEYLQLSGIQHFSFCRRQWALIHIEQQWTENLRTLEGRIMHEKAHDSSVVERRGDLMIIRDLAVASAELGIAGKCDVVEFRLDPAGVHLHGYMDKWQPYPVEYKRGSSKMTDMDRLQLCAQAICLEEMLCCGIPQGALFYGEVRHREKVEFTEELRREVRLLYAEMHELYRRQYTPKVKISKSCNACSLKDICVPKLMKKKSVRHYLEQSMRENE